VRFQNISEFPPLESLDSKSRKSLKSILNNLYYRFLIQEQQFSLKSYLSQTEFRYCFYQGNFKPAQLTLDKSEIITTANTSHTNFPDSPNLRKAEMGNIPTEQQPGVAEKNRESSSSPSLFLCCFGRNKIHHFREDDGDFSQPQAAPEDKFKTEIKSVSIIREKKLNNRVVVLDNSSQRNSAAESYRQLQKILSPLIPSLNSFYYQLKYFEVQNDGNSFYLTHIKTEQQLQPPTKEESKNNNLKHDHHLVLQSVEDDSENNNNNNNKEMYQKENENEKDNIPSCSAEKNNKNEDILKVFLYQNVGILFQSETDYNQRFEKTEEIIDFLEWIQFCFHQNIFPDVEIIPE
jgi:hypothetical protein